MFTNSCFIRKNTLKLREYLRLVGYRTIYNEQIDSRSKCLLVSEGDTDRIDTFAFYASHDETFINRYFSNREDVIDCGENEELFKAIAALRNDSDYMQWFVTEADQCWANLNVYSPKGSFELCLNHDRYVGQNEMFCNTIVPAHKATVKELIEHFKDK